MATTFPAPTPKIPRLYQQGTIYRLIISNEDAPPGCSKPKRVVCTYHNGQRIHGSGPHAPSSHPPVVLSAKGQDSIIWVGAEPFEIQLEVDSPKGAPGNPFYRPLDASNKWQATQGTDNTWRINTGPVKPETWGEEDPLKDPIEYKFSAYALTATGASVTNSESLDPHIVVEP